MPSLFVYNVKHAQKSILEESQINFGSDGIIVSLTIESLSEGNLLYKNVCMNIFAVIAIMVSWRTL